MSDGPCLPGKAGSVEAINPSAKKTPLLMAGVAVEQSTAAELKSTYQMVVTAQR